MEEESHNSAAGLALFINKKKIVFIFIFARELKKEKRKKEHVSHAKISLN